jgi:DNA-binding HxlR family transcriptional regulator
MLLGDQWTLLILQRAFLGAERFQDWYDGLNISNASLSARLAQLVEAGVLLRTPARAGGGRSVYRLSESGLGTWTVFVAIWRWEQDWISAPRPTPTELVHDDCGARGIAPQLRCTACHKPASLRNVTARPLAELAVIERSFVPRRHRQQRTALEAGDRLTFHAETMEILGDRWNIPLLAVSMLGLRRFSEFERALGLPPSVLSQRLRRLTELEVFAADSGERTDHRREYRLTRKGRAFFDVLMLLSDWGNQYIPSADGNSLILDHVPCGLPLHPELACSGCDRTLSRASIHFALSFT